MKEQPVTFTVHFFLVLWIIDIYSYLVHIAGGGGGGTAIYGLYRYVSL